MTRYPDNCGPIEYINDEAYQIVARYPITKVIDPQGVKEWLECDTVFKSNRQNIFIFCNHIQSINYEEL